MVRAEQGLLRVQGWAKYLKTKRCSSGVGKAHPLPRQALPPGGVLTCLLVQLLFPRMLFALTL